MLRTPPTCDTVFFRQKLNLQVSRSMDGRTVTAEGAKVWNDSDSGSTRPYIYIYIYHRLDREIDRQIDGVL